VSIDYADRSPRASHYTILQNARSASRGPRTQFPCCCKIIAISSQGPKLSVRNISRERFKSGLADLALCVSLLIGGAAAKRRFTKWIIIGSDRRPEAKQRIEGKIVRFRSGRVRVTVTVMDN